MVVFQAIFVNPIRGIQLDSHIGLKNQIRKTYNVQREQICDHCGRLCFSLPPFPRLLLKPNKGFQQQPLCQNSLLSAFFPTFYSFLLYQISGLYFSDDISSDEISEELLIKKNCFEPGFENELRSNAEKIVFHNIEKETFHNPYDQEFRVTSAIEDGDLDLLKKSIDEPYIGSLGRLAKDELRHLKNSEYSFLEIANYLGFTSQSHMGKHFKQETGMTLKQYRTKYQLQEFME